MYMLDIMDGFNFWFFVILVTILFIRITVVNADEVYMCTFIWEQ